MVGNADMSSTVLIMTLREISGPAQGDAMELGALEAYVQEVGNAVAQVNTGGRIGMPTAFDTMRELLTTIDDALPKNAFLRKWLRARVGKDEWEQLEVGATSEEELDEEEVGDSLREVGAGN